MESSNALDFSQAVCWFPRSSESLALLCMGKRKEAPVATEQQLRRQSRLRALVDREKTQKAFAIKYEISEKYLSQMLRDHGKPDWRPVGNGTVKTLETNQELKLPRGYFDALQINEQALGQAESRPKNNVKALRIAVQSLFSVLHAKMQDTAEAIAEDILETAGTEFVQESILDTLVGTLRGDPQNEGSAEKAPRPAQSSPTSKRAVSAAKRPS